MAMIQVLRDKEYGRQKWRKDCVWKSSVLENLHSNSSNEFEIQTQTDGTSIPPMACEYSPYASQCDLVAVADEEGGINIYDLDAGRMKHVESWLAHENAVFDIAWHPRRQEMVTASGDLSLRLWDVTTRTCLHQYCQHEASVKCVSYNQRSPDIFASGSRDGDIMVWDSRQPGRVAVISKSHQSVAKRKTKANKGVTPSMSVTDCVFQDDYHLITCGATNGTIKVWDMRKNYSLFGNDPKPAYSFPYAGGGTAVHGYTSLALDGLYLYANCTDRSIYRFNVLTYPPDPTCTYYGHRVRGSFYIKLDLSPDSRFLLGGSADQSAYIWKVDDPGYPSFQLDGHTTEVTSISWNKFDFTKIATCGDDNKVVFWQCMEERQCGSPYMCSPFVLSESTPKPQWTPKHRKTESVIQTPRSRPQSVVDWLTPPSKRRFLGEEQLLRTSECTTPRSHHGSSEARILSPRKVDNGLNLPQRRLLLEMTEENLENSMTIAETLVTPPRPSRATTAPSAQLSKKTYKVKMRLFRRKSTRAKSSQAKRELVQLRTITSFFKR
ncbi:denticleless protein homolog B-like [Ornithodoros turicata]